MKVTITFLLLFHNYNGSMKIDIFDKDILLYTSDKYNEGLKEIKITVNWPTTLSIITSGKTPDDTYIDSNGNVLKDKSIEVVGILINEFPINVIAIEKIFECHWDTKITNEIYWGNNGTIFLKLLESTPVKYMLSLNNQFFLIK